MLLRAAGRWKKYNVLQNLLAPQASIMSKVLTFILGIPVQVFLGSANLITRYSEHNAPTLWPE
jgi:hypothetical protein